MSDFVIGHIRTWVPMGVGFALTWIARSLDIVIDEETSAQVVSLVSTIAAGLYYLIVRLVAERIPQVGILLGYNKAPAYAEEG